MICQWVALLEVQFEVQNRKLPPEAVSGLVL